MSDPIDIFEASAFRQTSNGFIIRVPSLWVIGKSRHYLASEAQKNEIVARVKRGRKRSLLLAFLLWLLVFAGFVAGEAFLTGHDDPTVRDTIVMIVFALISLLLFLNFWYVLLLQPSLRLLTPTNERTTLAERRTALRAAMRQKVPSGQFLMVGVLLSLSCCFSLYSYFLASHGARHFSFENGSGFASLFAAAVSGLAAALFFYREIRSSRSEGDAAGEKTAELHADLLDARFERLRSDHNQLRRSVTIAAAAIAATVVGATVLNGTVRTVDADRLILRNGKGEIAAMLAVGKDGAPTLDSMARTTLASCSDFLHRERLRLDFTVQNTRCERCSVFHLPVRQFCGLMTQRARDGYRSPWPTTARRIFNWRALTENPGWR